jgi:hypothetical protein
MESQIVKEWTAQARAEGKAEGKTEGKTEGKAESVVDVLEARFMEVPADLRKTILAETNTARLVVWLGFASTARNLRQFCTHAGL